MGYNTPGDKENAKGSGHPDEYNRDDHGRFAEKMEMADSGKPTIDDSVKGSEGGSMKDIEKGGPGSGPHPVGGAKVNAQIGHNYSAMVNKVGREAQRKDTIQGHDKVAALHREAATYHHSIGNKEIGNKHGGQASRHEERAAIIRGQSSRQSQPGVYKSEAFDAIQSCLSSPRKTIRELG